MHKNHPLAESIGYAVEGLHFAFIEGRNFKIQIGFASLVLTLGFVLSIEIYEWLALIVIITIVLILELINTAIETVVDMVSLKFHPLAKIAKDVTAGAVLVAATASVVTGMIIFLPKLIQ